MNDLYVGLNDKVRFDMGDHKLEPSKNGNNIDLEELEFILKVNSLNSM